MRANLSLDVALQNRLCIEFSGDRVGGFEVRVAPQSIADSVTCMTHSVADSKSPKLARDFLSH